MSRASVRGRGIHMRSTQAIAIALGLLTTVVLFAAPASASVAPPQCIQPCPPPRPVPILDVDVHVGTDGVHESHRVGVAYGYTGFVVYGDTGVWSDGSTTCGGGWYFGWNPGPVYTCA